MISTSVLPTAELKISKFCFSQNLGHCSLAGFKSAVWKGQGNIHSERHAALPTRDEFTMNTNLKPVDKSG